VAAAVLRPVRALRPRPHRIGSAPASAGQAATFSVYARAWPPRATWWHGQHDLGYMRLEDPRGRQRIAGGLHHDPPGRRKALTEAPTARAWGGGVRMTSPRSPTMPCALVRYALRSPVSGSGEVTTQAGCDAPHKLHVGRLEVGAALTARQHKGYIRVLVEVRKLPSPAWRTTSRPSTISETKVTSTRSCSRTSARARWIGAAPVTPRLRGTRNNRPQRGHSSSRTQHVLKPQSGHRMTCSSSPLARTARRSPDRRSASSRRARASGRRGRDWEQGVGRGHRVLR
jgi:hypothetical protein